MDRARQRRERKRAGAPPSGALGGRFVRWVVIGFVLVALLAFSLAWPQGMPTALYIGLAAGLGWVVVAYAGRAVARRASAAGSPTKR